MYETKKRKNEQRKRFQTKKREKNKQKTNKSCFFQSQPFPIHSM